MLMMGNEPSSIQAGFLKNLKPSSWIFNLFFVVLIVNLVSVCLVGTRSVVKDDSARLLAVILPSDPESAVREPLVSNSTSTRIIEVAEDQVGLSEGGNLAHVSVNEGSQFLSVDGKVFSSVWQNDTSTVAESTYSYRFPRRSFMKLLESNEISTVVLVLSTAEKKHRRDMIRDTWANGTHNVFFVIAGEWTESVENEFITFEDVIWIDMEDSYHGLTTKVYVAFHAAHNHLECKHVIKADDDVYINLPAMTNTIDTAEEEFAIIGLKVVALQVLRAKDNTKWPMPYSVYAKKRYPPYCHGPAYAVSNSFLSCALEKIARQPAYFFIEDAQGGVLAQACDQRVAQRGKEWITMRPQEADLQNHSKQAIHFGRMLETAHVGKEAQLATVMFRVHRHYNPLGACYNCFYEVLRGLTGGKLVKCGESGNELAARCQLCPGNLGAGSCGGDCVYKDLDVLSKNGRFASIEDAKCQPIHADEEDEENAINEKERAINRFGLYVDDLTAKQNKTMIVGAGQGTTGTHAMLRAMCNMGIPTVHYEKECLPISTSDEVQRAKEIQLQITVEDWLTTHCVLRNTTGEKCGNAAEWLDTMIGLFDSLISTGVVRSVHDTPFPSFLAYVLQLVSRHYRRVMLLLTERQPEDYIQRRSGLSYGAGSLICKDPQPFDATRLTGGYFDSLSCLEFALDRASNPREIDLKDVFVSLSSRVNNTIGHNEMVEAYREWQDAVKSKSSYSVNIFEAKERVLIGDTARAILKAVPSLASEMSAKLKVRPFMQHEVLLSYYDTIDQIRKGENATPVVDLPTIQSVDSIKSDAEVLKPVLSNRTESHPPFSADAFNGLVVQPEDLVFNYSSPFVLPQYRLLFYPIAKAGCTAFKKLLRRMMGYQDWRTLDPHGNAHDGDKGLLQLYQFSAKDANEIMTDPRWTRAVFYREPRERLVSFYLDKVGGRKNGRYIRRICCMPEQMNDSAVYELLSCDQVDISQDVIDSAIPRLSLKDFLARVAPACGPNPHWGAQHLVVPERFLPYINFVGHLETADFDTKRLLQRVGAWEKVGLTGWGVTGDDNEPVSVFQNISYIPHSTNSSSQLEILDNPDVKALVDDFLDKDERFWSSEAAARKS